MKNTIGELTNLMMMMDDDDDDDLCEGVVDQRKVKLTLFLVETTIETSQWHLGGIESRFTEIEA